MKRNAFRHWSFCTVSCIAKACSIVLKRYMLQAAVSQGKKKKDRNRHICRQDDTWRGLQNTNNFTQRHCFLGLVFVKLAGRLATPSQGSNGPLGEFGVGLWAFEHEWVVMWVKRKNEDNTTVNARFMVRQTITQRNRITQFCKNGSLTNFVIEEHNRTRKIHYRVYQSTKRWRAEKKCVCSGMIKQN